MFLIILKQIIINTVTDCLKRTLYWGHIPMDERIRWMSVRMSLPLM